MTDLLDICVDDTRSFGHMQIRDPTVAIMVLRRLLKQTRLTYWDNDMGYGWEYEGRNLLKQFIQDCKNAKWYPHVVIVTSNSVAAEDMKRTLVEADYAWNNKEGAWVHAG